MSWRERLLRVGEDTAYFLLGSVLIGLALAVFARNAPFVPAGLGGIALLIYHFTGLPIGTMTFVLNIPMVLISMKIIGGRFLGKSVWAIILNTLATDLLLHFIPPYAGDPLLAAAFTGVCLGAGLALTYMRGASTGGTDFLILSIKKLRPHFSVGQITILFQVLIVGIGGLVYQSLDAVLYGTVCSFATTMTMDKILNGMGSSKAVAVITQSGAEIAREISEQLVRGSTQMKVIGSYTGESRDMLCCFCSKREAHRVRSIARTVDVGALVIVWEASEVIGKGFPPPNLPGKETVPELTEQELQKKKQVRQRIRI